MGFNSAFKGLSTELNPICHMLALLGPHHILHVSRIRVNIQDIYFSINATRIPVAARSTAARLLGLRA
jgi:hypothetical protein